MGCCASGNVANEEKSADIVTKDNLRTSNSTTLPVWIGYLWVWSDRYKTAYEFSCDSIGTNDALTLNKSDEITSSKKLRVSFIPISGSTQYAIKTYDYEYYFTVKSIEQSNCGIVCNSKQMPSAGSHGAFNVEFDWNFFTLKITSLSKYVKSPQNLVNIIWNDDIYKLVANSSTQASMYYVCVIIAVQYYDKIKMNLHRMGNAWNIQ